MRLYFQTLILLAESCSQIPIRDVKEASARVKSQLKSSPLAGGRDQPPSAGLARWGCAVFLGSLFLEGLCRHRTSETQELALAWRTANPAVYRPGLKISPKVRQHGRDPGGLPAWPFTTVNGFLFVRTWRRETKPAAPSEVWSECVS